MEFGIGLCGCLWLFAGGLWSFAGGLWSFAGGLWSFVGGLVVLFGGLLSFVIVACFSNYASRSHTLAILKLAYRFVIQTQSPKISKL